MKVGSIRRQATLHFAWVLALLVTLIGLFTHLYRLGHLWPVPRFDAATNGLDALRILRRGVRPIFFPANGGREPLFIYLQALALWRLGINNFALRVPGALAGALAVPALFGFARSLLAAESRSSARWVPAWASVGLALSVWHVSQTQQGLRAALLPLTSVGVFWLFVVGWRRASLPRLAGAGAFLGLTAYTYTAARFLPFVLTLTALPDLVLKPTAGATSRWQRWLGFSVLTLAALVVFAPLGWYYLRHPVMFDERAASVMVWNVRQPISSSTLAEELGLNVWRTVVWFAGFPVPLFASLVVGLGFTLTHLHRLEHRLLAVWWLVMLLPAVFTIETPDPLRSLGAAPPTYLLIALGLAAVAGWLTRRWPVSADVTLAGGLLVVALSSFPLWGYLLPAKHDWFVGRRALVDALATEAQTSVVYLPLSAYADPRVRFLLAAEFESRADWSAEALTASSQLVQPVGDYNSPILVRLSPDGWITLLPPLGRDGQAVLRQSARDGQPIVDRYGTVIGYEVTLPGPADPARYLAQANFTADATVVGLADLIGYSLDSPERGGLFPHLVPGSPLWVTTFWRARGGTSEDYDLIIHLIDDAGRMWGRADDPPLEGAYPTSLWRPGERVADGRPLWVYPDAPPGRYWLAVAFYEYTTDSRLPVAPSSMPCTIRLGPLKIPLPPVSERRAGVQPQQARFGDVAQLLGYRLTTQPTGFTLSLYWQAESPDGIDYTVFVHMLDAQGHMVKGQDNQPVNGSYPTGIWEPGEIILDKHAIVTGDLPPGEYRLELGMYVLETGERLPVHMPDGAEDSAHRLMLTTPIEVR